MGDKVLPGKDKIRIDSNLLKAYKNENIYIMLYKPRGYVTTLSDEFGRKNVSDLVKKENVRLFPVGRLDKDSEGLLLMTNDGDFANRVTHPKNRISKTYRVIIKDKISKEQIQKMSKGIYIESDDYMSAPCEIEIKEVRDDRTIILMTLYEGKNREIRKMCEAVDLEILRLKREKIGKLSISTLKSGQYRRLSEKEIKLIF